MNNLEICTHGIIKKCCAACNPAKPAERKMVVGLSAPGFAGRFEIPEKHFDKLLKWLETHACRRVKKPAVPRGSR